MLAKFEGGKIFSTLYLNQAYQQLKVVDETALILTITTSKGLYRVKRLPFGISAAPAFFQQCIETTLAGIKGVCAYLDDIIVKGSTQEERNEHLGLVLAILQTSEPRETSTGGCVSTHEALVHQVGCVQLRAGVLARQVT